MRHSLGDCNLPLQELRCRPVPYGANIYNPGSKFQPIVQFPYQPNPNLQPLQAIFSVKISL